ncbi:MAG: peptidase E [Phycisphaerales bacterium]
MPVQGQIIALGGGGFLMEPDNLALDRYILGCARHASPRVCFVPTASGDSQDMIRRFHESFSTLDCTPSVLSLFREPPQDLQAFVMAQDVIYVGGGNTRNLLTLWRDWGLDRILHQAVEAGVVLSGVSAGSICWFGQGVTDSMQPPGSDRLDALPCLGFLPGSNCPHYDGETNRRPAYHRLLEAGEIGEGLAADDGVGLHFIDGRLDAVVSSRPGTAAYRVRLMDGSAREETLQPRLLV